MTKYNITPKKVKMAAYRNLVNPELMDRLETHLNTNSRYISAVINVRFKMNYTSFVNKQRIKDAMALLSKKDNKSLNMEDISDMVGFANRQSFYASFFRINKITPREYKLKQFSKRAAKRPLNGENAMPPISEGVIPVAAISE